MGRGCGSWGSRESGLDSFGGGQRGCLRPGCCIRDVLYVGKSKSLLVGAENRSFGSNEIRKGRGQGSRWLSLWFLMSP